MLSNVLVVFVVSEGASDALTTAFERAARDALGESSGLRVEAVARDLPDEKALLRAGTADGVVELSWSEDGRSARVHYYVARKRRWLERRVKLDEGGASDQSADADAAERGRLLGFAVATMFTREQQPAERDEPAAPAKDPSSAPRVTKPGGALEGADAARSRSGKRVARALEFAGIGASGIGGPAHGLGAMAGLRVAWPEPFWLRVAVAGRAGDIPAAQASSRTAQLGLGLSFNALPASSRAELGLRTDALLGYFDVTHLATQEQDIARRSRWFFGGDALLEGGYRFGDAAGLYAGAGLEGVLGTTEIYTLGRRQATVPVLRGVAELGFRSRF